MGSGSRAVPACLLAIVLSTAAGGDTGGLRARSPFFNGRDLTGWEGNRECWTVEKGEIVGRMVRFTRCEFLRAAKEVRNFRLVVEVKLVNDLGDSGIMFRGPVTEEGDMPGLMADIGQERWGCLVERSTQKYLAQPADLQVHRGEWNLYEVVAVGSRVLTALNGKKCCDLEVPAMPAAGRIGLQLNWGNVEVRFRKLTLEPNPLRRTQDPQVGRSRRGVKKSSRGLGFGRFL